jgi:hypothetical protein
MGSNRCTSRRRSVPLLPLSSSWPPLARIVASASRHASKSALAPRSTSRTAKYAAGRWRSASRLKTTARCARYGCSGWTSAATAFASVNRRRVGLLFAYQYLGAVELSRPATRVRYLSLPARPRAPFGSAIIMSSAQAKAEAGTGLVGSRNGGAAGLLLPPPNCAAVLAGGRV